MKNLVLHSNQILPNSEIIEHDWIGIIGKSKPVLGYISSISDPKRIYYQIQKSYYARFGINLAVYFELDVSFDTKKLTTLFACDAIHLSGGNTFYFLHYLRKRNMIEPLKEYVKKGGILIGVSAGAILMTRNVSSAILCGDTPIENDSNWDALGLVKFAFAPHFESIKDGIVTLQQYANKHKVKVYSCRDGDGIIIQGEQVKCFGNVVLVEPSKC
jgi:dipeptidase E